MGTNPRRRRPASMLDASFRSGRVDFNMIAAQTVRSATLRLLVFRPGTSTGDRAKTALYCWLTARGLYVMVAAVTFVLTPAPLRSLGVWWWLGFSAAVTGAIVLIAWHLAQPVLAAAHSIRVRVYPSGHGVGVSGDLPLLEEYVTRLSALESADLNPVDHEAQWSRIYEDLSAITNPARSNS